MRERPRKLHCAMKTRFEQAIGRAVPTIDIVDVGAMAEGGDRYDALVAAGLARVTGFEPNAENLRALAARSGPYRYLPHVIGSGAEATLHVTRYPGCTSLFEPDPAVIDLFSTIACAPPEGNFHVERTERVRT